MALIRVAIVDPNERTFSDSSSDTSARDVRNIVYTPDQRGISNPYRETSPVFCLVTLNEISGRKRATAVRHHLPEIEFPLTGYEETLTIGSLANDCNFYIQSARNEDIVFGAFHIKDYRVDLVSYLWMFGHTGTQSHSITVNGGILERGESRNIAHGALVAFDNLEFLVSIDIGVVVQWIKALIRQITCRRCRKLVVLEYLPCGHSLCRLCRTDRTFIRQMYLQFAYEPVPENNEAAIQCPFCRRWNNAMRHSDNWRRPIMHRISEKTFKLFKTTTVCSKCYNWRCLTAENEYWNCRDCDSILCPVCAINHHLDHTLILRNSDKWRNEAHWRNKYFQCVINGLSLQEKVKETGKKAMDLLSGFTTIKLELNEQKLRLDRFTKPLFDKLTEINRLTSILVRINDVSLLKSRLNVFEALKQEFDESHTVIQELTVKLSDYVDKISSIIAKLPRVKITFVDREMHEYYQLLD